MMKDFKNFTTLEAKLKYLLQENETTRDNDMHLISCFYFYELEKENVIEMSAVDLLTLISKNKLPNFESLRRIRQNIQQKHPELRGEFYGKKKKVSRNNWI